MMKYLCLCICLFALLPFDEVKGEEYFFRVYLKDKGCSGYSVDQPEQFLSEEALQRRARQGIAVTESDLPIASHYIEALEQAGGRCVVQSRWLSTVVVETQDSLTVNRLAALPMVDSVKWVWKGERESQPMEEELSDRRLNPSQKPLKNPYGYAEEQIAMLNGIKLHQAGFMGQGMRVAIIDAGFRHADRISLFDSLQLLGTHNVVFPDRSVFQGEDHGTKVLSCLAAQTSGIMIGTAPRASYWLIKSEDGQYEYPMEEDYWAAAIEFADRVGVEVVSSSLGYFVFELEGSFYKPSDLDGQTALITRAATMAAEKGLLIFCSAGNEGNSSWEKIIFPADAPGIVSVGAVTSDRKRCNFSSLGLTSDGRVKPDMVALGAGCCVVDSEGEIDYANGTSFATPILAGLGVCLWQAFPQLSNKELIALMQQYSHRYKHPDKEMGYGLPNVYKIYKKQKKYAVDFN